MPGFIDLTGQRFGRWLVLGRAENSKDGRPRWLCRCDCGREQVVHGNSLRYGKSRGCRSCQISDKNTTHGQSGTRLYRVWQGMIQRCENPNRKFYECYGSRGIKVCAEWRNDPAAFINWATVNGYKEGLTIDRINNDGDYTPENCRFVSRMVQNRNYRRNRIVKIGNETKLIIEHAEQSGINIQALRHRIDRGWPEHRLLEPVRITMLKKNSVTKLLFAPKEPRQA